MKTTKKIVCLGGGIGTVNLIKGLTTIADDITVVVSMADEGGSAGRLRRLFNIFPPGDLVSCMAASLSGKSTKLEKLLTYRFPGNRYATDGSLAGHKLGNLLLVAMRDVTGSFSEGLELFQTLFDIKGRFLPATAEEVSISAKTIEGKMIIGEENIDRGKYSGKRILDKVFLHPEHAKPGNGVIEAMKNADVIIAGPGDLYTTTLPVLIVPTIKNALIESKAEKIFIVNIANKPFETKGYTLSDYISAIKKHLGEFPFDTIIVNNNFSHSIPKKFHYHYVFHNKKDQVEPSVLEKDITFIEADLVNEDFPLYHSPDKLAKIVSRVI